MMAIKRIKVKPVRITPVSKQMPTRITQYKTKEGTCKRCDICRRVYRTGSLSSINGCCSRHCAVIKDQWMRGNNGA